MKIAVVTDSTSYINPEVRRDLDIHMIPLNVIFDSESFKEEVEISWQDFYERVKIEEALPKSSQPAIGEFIELFDSLGKEYDAIICITLSSGISGTYQTAVAASNMVESAKVYVFDSEISCAPEAFYVLEAAKMAKEGCYVDQILDRLQEIKTSLRAYFMVDDLQHLQRGGRLSGAQAFVGSILQVKPILHFENKKIVPFEKVRTRKKALAHILAMLDEVAREGKPMEVVVIHGNCFAEAGLICNEISNKYPNISTNISYFGPVIGTHLGEGSLGITWYVK
ncbi:MAG: hypothetical protein K0S51_1505 [Bacillales bacterium]|nr:hypothetical protein [Bacillales bacterium]